MKKKRSRSKRQDALWGYLFVAPFLIGFMVFMLGPMLFSFIGSFYGLQSNVKNEFYWFWKLQTNVYARCTFWKSLYNTIYFVLFNVPLTTLFSVFLATLLNQKIRGISFFRTTFYLPAILSGVAVYVLWMQLLSPSAGLINTF